MIESKAIPFYVVMGLVVAWYCSHAFGIRPLAQNYHTIKPALVSWHNQTTPSPWYGHNIELNSEGLVVSRPPVSWDLFVELVILISGGLYYLQIETDRSKSRNVVLIIRATGVSLGFVGMGILLESRHSSTTIVPANALLVWLGILMIFGRAILFLPVGKVRYLVPFALLFLLLHWTAMEYGFGDPETSKLNDDSLVETDSNDVIEPLSVWDYDSGIVDRVRGAINRILPMSVRNSGLGGDYVNYSAFNLVAYAGLYLIGMAVASLSLTEGNNLKLAGKLLVLSLSFWVASVLVQGLGIPAVPRLASATHILLAASLGCGLLMLSSILTSLKHLRSVLMPLTAMGTASALMYVLERTLGVAFRTEVDKHAEPFLEPLFGEAWLKWEPIVFYNLVFLIFSAACIYCYRKRIHFRL
ncbi:MAG: hypothetical protein CMJ82_13055 [Planctomycetaceae bacterium]|nr:hypothetical protein [Planctomycetaceae bacterium]